jgi:competence protein ComEC
MSFPFLFLALPLAAGVVFSSIFEISLPLQALLVLFFLVWGWLFYSFRKYRLSFIAIVLTSFFLGGALFIHSHKEYVENALHKMNISTYTDFIGTAYKSPGYGLDIDFLYLKVEEVRIGKDRQKINGNLRVTIPHSSEFPSRPNWLVHDKLKISAKLGSAKGYQNFYPSHQDQYLEIQKIHNRAYAKSPLLIEKLDSGKSLSPLRIISKIRQKLQINIESYFSGDQNTLVPEGAILEALLLGERRRMPGHIIRSLQDAGIYHLFAISGAHIAIFSFLLFSFFKAIRFSTRLSYALLIAFLLFYALLVEGRPSVLRATIMTVAYLLGKLLWRDVNLINTLSFSAFFLLCANPSSLFAPGFQLTFAATLAIILFYPRIVHKLPRLPLRISEIFALSLTAQLGVLPVVALTFNRVSFSGIILNYAAIPLVASTMAIGYIFLPMSLLNAFSANLLSKLASFLIHILLGISHFHDQASFCSFRVPTPHYWTVCGYFLFLGFFLLPVKYKRQRLATSGFFLVFLVILVTYPFPSNSKNLKMTFIDVGQGESILVEFPGTTKMLIDGGGTPDDKFDIGEYVVSPLLWRKGIKTIHYLVLTHPHPDHMNGLKAVAKNFKIHEFWEGYSVLEDESYTRFQATLHSSVSRKRMFRGSETTIAGVHVQFFHPPQKEPFVNRVHNDFSLVMQISHGQNSFLLTGDIGKEVEEILVEGNSPLGTRVLKSPHHGSHSSSSSKFLGAVAPEIVVISVGRGNIYGLPNREVLARYIDTGAKVYRTDIHGAVEITADRKKLSVRTALTPLPNN